MPNTPLVSVVMPVYNHERYVIDAIRSVFDQTWRPLELIMIDDGSTDGSAAAIRRFLADTPAPEGVTVSFDSRPNKGAHTTINEGLAKAAGTYIAVLNSDDAYLPERLAKCVRAAQEHAARLIFTYVDPIDDDGAPLPQGHRWRSWYADVMLEEMELSPSISTLLLRYNVGISTGNFVFHRSLLDDIGPFADFRYAHDVDFLLRACFLEEPVILREKLYRYRVHASNTIAESDDRITDEYAEIVRRYLARTLAEPPVNPVAPSFDNWTWSLAAAPWPPHLGRAMDRLLTPPPAPRGPARPAAATAPERVRAPQGAPHVTLVTHELSYTGAPVLLRDVGAALHGHGVATSVISLTPGPLAADFATMGSPVVQESRLARTLTSAGNFLARQTQHPRMPAPLGKGLRAVARVSDAVGHRLRIRTYMAAAEGTLLINSFACWPLALALLKRWRGRAFWYIHETYEPGLIMRSGAMHDRLRALVDDGRVTLMFGSDATRAVWAAAGYDGIVRYWSGLPAAGTESSPDDAAGHPVVLSVQSTGTRKGTRALIEAFALGRRKGWIAADVELRIIGCHKPSQNPLMRDLLKRVHQPDLRGAVSLVPGQPPAALDRHYREAAVYVQSSIMECLPLALLTAMAHGLPIVSSDADGCREAILEGRTGRLVPQRQSELMARAIADLLSDRTTAAALGRGARDWFVERFALEATVPPLVETLLPGNAAIAPVGRPETAHGR
ncbi:glycosyltransferase [Caenispirillum bisanense]|uniref:Glycosyltransferase involved in cell wall bisynthesis n=1 Tax=Caenispirillum bisanense TaxID=414052 RepID=A0A286GTB4_9PROT|nr:glycosyltransferase [Caenispirillum bisanense]SOD98785.1 Glycosyltransferase involved in cell wall bisynthesis [Caenispirillum bisanense]